MVVLGGDEHIAIVLVDFSRPGFGVVFGVLLHHGRRRLIQQRQVEIGNVDQLELGIAAFLGFGQYPVGDGFGVAARAGAAQDDGDLQHWVAP